MHSADQSNRTTGTLSERYRIVRQIGAGAAALVYQAEDLKHHRDVAIKVLRPDVAAALGPERFLREIAIIARLNHPRVLPLIDSGEAEGSLFYVMPFVQGYSLRDRLEREEQLPLDEALLIVEQIAGALDYAHQQGVIHRDIKPENILLHQGEALIADFGIALSRQTVGEERLTQVGLGIGTPEYMSPEQALAERELDARSDIYSLACVLYELLTGEPPYTGHNAQAVIAKRLTDAVPSARRLRATVPSAVDNSLKRALAKAPADRFGSAGAFARALRAKDEGTDAKAKSLVVLPFSNLSADPENEYFGDGLTDELITELSKIRALRVISRTSAMLFKGARKSIPAIAEQLGVRFALEGTVRRSGESVRITSQLIDAATDTQVWAGRYTGTLANIFDLQETLARRITQELQLKLTPDEERRLAARPIADPWAYDVWLLAMHKGRTFSKEGIDSAIRLTNQALAMIGDNALLYAALGYFYWGLYDFNISHDEATLREAERFAAKALELNPELAQAQFAMGLVRYKRGDMQSFVRYAVRAWQLDRSSDAGSFLGFGLAEVGRITEARRFADDAVARDPLVFTTLWARATVDLFAGNFVEALERLRQAASELAPGDPFAGWWLAQAAAYAGNDAEARLHAEQSAALNTGFWSDWCTLFDLAWSDDRDAVMAMLDRTNLRETASTDEYYPVFLANCLTRVGEHDAALQWLEQAITWGFTNHRFLAEENRLLAPLHGLPRFEALLEDARQRERAFQLDTVVTH